jgi:hypothetical protein
MRKRKLKRTEQQHNEAAPVMSGLDDLRRHHEVLFVPHPDLNRQTVVARVTTQTSLDRMRAKGSITSQQYEAGERFHADFERGGVGAKYARVDLTCPRSGVPIDGNGRYAARERLFETLSKVGSTGGSILWDVCGCGFNVAEWAAKMRASGRTMSNERAHGVLIAAIDVLVAHYGIA